jgi:hypothetical protein
MSWFERSRPLTAAEKALAQTVFLGFLPYDDIYVGDHTGLGGAPWTQYSWVDEVVGDRYTLHLGPVGYGGANSAVTMPGFGVVREIFIHELTHVWQGSHSHVHGWYQAQSALSQAWAILRTGNRNNAYGYSAGQDWSKYNVEQQANIVEDWFRNGSNPSDPLYRYIANVRR